jgi:hypothetical protein
MKNLLLLTLLLLSQLTYAQQDESIKTFRGHSALVSSLAYSPDGKIAISGSFDNTLRLWDIATGKCLKTLSGHSNYILDVAFSPDGKTAISGSYDKTLKLWDIGTGQCLKTFSGHSNHTMEVAFSPDGKTVLSGSEDHTLKLWDIATGQCLKTLSEHSNHVYSVAFSPDGKTALSGSNDRTLKLWDIATGQCLKTFSGHSEWVTSVAFSPDGKTALSGSAVDNPLKLWDIATGQCLKNLSKRGSSILSVAFSPDGKTALSSADNTLKLWDLSKYVPTATVQTATNSNTDKTAEYKPANSTPEPIITKKPIDNNGDVTPLEINTIDDVDTNIPSTTIKNDNTFVLIIVNENYKNESSVDYAIRDGSIFKDYCIKTFGIPTENIHFVRNATYGEVLQEKNWLVNLLNAYKGQGKAIFYYAGHGITASQNEPAYLLPVDGTSSDINTGIKLDDIYSNLAGTANNGITVFIDACFSGSKRDNGMLASSRGTKLKPREITLDGNMVLFSAASGDETAWPYKDKQHGMFTYYLLKKLQETKGDVTYKDLSEYINDNVYKTSIKVNYKPQTPTVKAGSNALGWESWKLK